MMLLWPWAKAEWRAVCAERCTYGSGRRSASALLTLLKVKGKWTYLYRAIDSNGDTVELPFSRNRDLRAAKRFLRKAVVRRDRPARITIDGSLTTRMAIMQCDAYSVSNLKPPPFHPFFAYWQARQVYHGSIQRYYSDCFAKTAHDLERLPHTWLSGPCDRIATEVKATVISSKGLANEAL